MKRRFRVSLSSGLAGADSVLRVPPAGVGRRPREAVRFPRLCDPNPKFSRSSHDR